MKEIELKYGCNPNQKPSKIYMKDGSDLPLTVLNGKPGYINFLDAFNSWQLVKELKEATGLAAAASFKHVSPSGSAIYKELTEKEKKIYFIDEKQELSEIAIAYIKARGTDRLSSFGDFVAISEECDVSLANYLRKEVSDGIIAPSYSKEALDILKEKKNGNYCVIQIDENYIPELQECKDVYGITFEQGRNNYKIDNSLFDNIVTENKNITEDIKNDMKVALITLKYTQSNSVCYVKNGQAIGIGAGQQSRIHCTRLAGNKADNWYLRQHDKVLNLPFKKGIKRADRDNTIDIYISNDYEYVLKDGIWQTLFETKPDVLTSQEKKEWLASQSGLTIGSDAFFPFGDNIERAHKSGCNYVVEPGGSIRDDNVIETANKYGMIMVFTSMRLFHH